MDEKRCRARWKVELPVKCVGLEKNIESFARTQDISTVGAKLAMIDRYDQGDRLQMILDIPSSVGSPICIDADVVWQEPGGNLNQECNYMTGVVFRRVNDCSKKDLIDHVHSNYPEEFRRHWWDGV